MKIISHKLKKGINVRIYDNFVNICMHFSNICSILYAYASIMSKLLFNKGPNSTSRASVFLFYFQKLPLRLYE